MLAAPCRTAVANRAPQRLALAVEVFATDLGWMALATEQDVVYSLTFGHATPQRAVAALERVVPGAQLDENAAGSAMVEELVERLRRYTAGEPVEWADVQIGQRHLTRFGRRVVAACRRIRRGQTRSYGQLAAACGSPGAARAVGQVMARNRYPLLVPCHRVLAAGGTLGGFSAPEGLAMKRRLLAMEGAV